jgi:hypothetical protein
MRPSEPGTGALPSLSVCGLHLAALWAIAVPQPLFNLIADAPEFFVARGNLRGDIVAFALGLTILPPLAMTAAEAVAGLVGRGPRYAIHLVLVAALVAAIALQALKGTGGSAALLIPLALAIGAGAAVAYARLPNARLLATVLIPAPLIVLVLFLFISPVHRLILPQGSGKEATTVVHGDAPVVFLVFDEFSTPQMLDRDGRINARRYPHFAVLARISTWYRNATTVSTDTTRAVPAILSSRGPRRGTVPTTLDYPNNLFTLLGRSYRVRAQEPITALCPTRICGKRHRPGFASRMDSLTSDLSVVFAHLQVPKDLENDLPAVDRGWQDFHGGADAGAGSSSGAAEFASSANPGAPVPLPGQKGFKREFKRATRQRSRDFDRFLAGIGPSRGGRPTLNFLHIALPHLPYRYLPSGQQYEIEGEDLPGIPGESWVSDPFPVAQAEQRYMLQVGFCDRLVGRLIDRMRRLGILGRALLVVTADHGVAFRPGDVRRSATPGNYEQLAGMPLFIKAPGQTSGRIDDAHVLTTDILPTVADLLNVRIPFPVEGRSALRPPVDRPVHVVNFDFSSITRSFRDYARRRDQQVRRDIAAFGQGDLDSLYRFGPRPELIEKKVADLPQGAAVGGLDLLNPDPNVWSNVDPRAPLVPTWIRAATAYSGDVAVAVDGQIAATTRPSDGKLSALVPAAAFRRGHNTVELFAVSGSAGAPHLSRLARY